MNVSLTPKLEAMIRTKVDSGMYNNASEVVREALRIMDVQERDARLRAALEVGLDQIENGQMREWTPDSMARIMRKADEADRLGLPISNDIKP